MTIEVDGKLLRIVNFYGVTCGHNSEEAVMQTDHLIGVIRDELEEHPNIPTLIVGDLNAEPEDVPIVQEMLQEEGWTDCAGQAGIWGRTGGQGTCTAPNSKRTTRRDYIFACPVALPMIAGCEVHKTDEFAVHQPLRIYMQMGTKQVRKQRYRKTASAKEKFEERLESRYK